MHLLLTVVSFGSLAISSSGGSTRGMLDVPWDDVPQGRCRLLCLSGSAYNKAWGIAFGLEIFGNQKPRGIGSGRLATAEVDGACNSWPGAVKVRVFRPVDLDEFALRIFDYV